MKKALISIDYTYDFIVDGGKLTVGKPAQAVEEAITRTTKEAYEAGNYIFSVIDGHDGEDGFHPETKSFPPHNIRGTSGHDLYGQLVDLYIEVEEDNRVFWLDKCHCSAFSGAGLDIRLRKRCVTAVVLTGILVDICVPHTAIDAYDLGHDIKIPAEATVSSIKENHRFTLNYLKNILGAKIA